MTALPTMELLRLVRAVRTLQALNGYSVVTALKYVILGTRLTRRDALRLIHLCTEASPYYLTPGRPVDGIVGNHSAGTYAC